MEAVAVVAWIFVILALAGLCMALSEWVFRRKDR